MEGFLKIPNDIRYSSELSPAEKMMLAEVMSWADDTGWSSVTSPYLAAVMDFTVRRAKQMVADLTRRGWIVPDRAANTRRLKVTPKPMAEGEINCTVKNISPCRVKKTSPSTVKNFSPHIINNNIQPTIQPARACEVETVEVGEIDENLEKLARDFAANWSEQGRLIMHRAKGDESMWPAVVLDTAQWLYLERSKLDPNSVITERDLRLAVTSPRCIKRAIKNIKENEQPGQPTNRKADINSEAARQERQSDYFANFADLAKPQDHRGTGTV